LAYTFDVRFVLISGGIAVCLTAVSGAGVITFTDATNAAFAPPPILAGADVTLGDIEGDGDLDIWLFNVGDIDDKMFRNDGSGVFEDITSIAGVGGTPGGGPEINGPLTDFDNDGLPDAYVATALQSNAAWNLFYRNTDGLVFVEIGELVSVRNMVDATSVNWVDLNQDGFADIYVGTVRRTSNHPFLYLNQAGVSFEDVWSTSGLDFTGGAGKGTNLWFDWEDDGDLDLYIGAFFDFDPSNKRDRLYVNDGSGQFSQAVSALNASPVATVSVQLADFDLDGTLEILAIHEQVANAVWDDQGDGTFENIAPALNLDMPNPIVFGDPERKSSAVVGDFDNDMDPDVFVTWWDLTIGGEPRNQLWLHEGGVYVERGIEAGITEEINAWACAAGDLNGDGFLDIYVVNDNGFGTRDTLYLNDGNANHWFEIDPIGTISNRDAIGLKVWLTAGGVTQVQELYSHSAHPTRLHFGLGPNTEVTDLTLRWPNGLVEQYWNIPADQVFRPVEGQTLPQAGAGVLLR
jgi:hypothetical protein